MPVQVIILGTLGDLVKKLVELEMLARTPSRDTSVQMSAYYAILEQWPVVDKTAVHCYIEIFRVECAKLLAQEASVMELSTQVKGKIGSAEWVSATSMLTSAMSRYLESKAKLKNLIIQLNSQGKYLGTPPLTLELQEG